MRAATLAARDTKTNRAALLGGDGGPFFASELDDVVSTVYVDDARSVSGRLLLVHPAVSGDDDEVTLRNEVSSGAVDADLPAAASTRYDVRREARTVGHVVDVDFLVLEEASGLHESDIDGDRPDVVDVRARDRGAMDLAQQELALHVDLRSGPHIAIPANPDHGAAPGGGQWRWRLSS